MCPKVTSLHRNPKSLQADSSRKRARGHHAPIHKENTFPTTVKTKDVSVFTPMKLPMDQILQIIKHQSWVKLPKTAQHDTDSLKVGNCSFQGSQRQATLHHWALKRHLEDLVQCGHLDEFILDLEEDPDPDRDHWLKRSLFGTIRDRKTPGSQQSLTRNDTTC